jgi:hypothetical protein
MRFLFSRSLWFAISGAAGISIAVAVISAGAIGGSSQSQPILHGPQAIASPMSVPALANMSALSNPATPKLARDAPVGSSNTLTGVASIITGNDSDIPAGMVSPGRAKLEGARVLLSKLGVNNRRIYAFPTDQDAVCAGLTDLDAGCLQGFNQDAPVSCTVGDPDRAGSGDPGLVWGLAPDQVVAIAVVVNGTKHGATLENNAYFYELGNNTIPAKAITGLVLHYRDGTVKDMAISQPFS